MSRLQQMTQQLKNQHEPAVCQNLPKVLIFFFKFNTKLEALSSIVLQIKFSRFQSVMDDICDNLINSIKI